MIFFSETIFRNDLIARSKIILSLRQREKIDHLSFARIVYLLNNKSLVVAESCDDQAWLEDCFLYADSDKFIDLCVETIERDDKEQLTEQFHERFKQKKMTDFLKPVVEELESVL